MLNEYEKGVTLRALKKLLNEYKGKEFVMNENLEAQRSDAVTVQCLFIRKTIELVEKEEVKKRTKNE